MENHPVVNSRPWGNEWAFRVPDTRGRCGHERTGVRGARLRQESVGGSPLKVAVSSWCGHLFEVVERFFFFGARSYGACSKLTAIHDGLRGR